MKIERISKGIDLLTVNQDQSVRVIMMQTYRDPQHSYTCSHFFFSQRARGMYEWNDIATNLVLRVLSLSPLKREKPGNEVD